MGCDGGTIPRRDELVRIKKKPEQKDKDAELAFRWRHCSIRQLPLQPPIVACSLGRLYSKESVLEGLLDRTTLTESAEHIKNLKDVKNLNLTPNPAYNGSLAEKGDCYVDGGKSPYICPVIGLEMNGKYKFCFLWTCGCVMSERSLKEVKSPVCHKCQTPYSPTDIVILNAEGDDLKKMMEQMLTRKSEKKGKKKARQAEGEADDGLKKKIKKEDSSTKAESSSSSSSSSKETKESKESKEKSRRTEAEDPAYKKSKEDYSIAKDPKASEVLKSIFTSHKSASEQTRAHWVTYNPFYN